VFGWAFAIWGTGLYYWAGALYFAQLRHLVQTVKPIKDATG
jgi:cardiolipin synthase